ncbi:MAG: Rdx family protein [Pseudomonadota bacterium]|nr:Rdx family protein [Pseudomonadota bacterium]
MKARLEAKGLKEFELVPGRPGQFDIAFGDELVFSRHRVGRFPTDDEVDALVG